MSISEFQTIRERLSNLTTKQREQLLKDLEREESLSRAADIAQGKNIIAFTPTEWENYCAHHSVPR